MGNQYIYNLACTMIGQLGITVAEFDSEPFARAQTLFEKRHDDVEKILFRMRPETLGKIAAHGREFGSGHPSTPGEFFTHGIAGSGRIPTSLYEVCQGDFGSKYSSGKYFLLRIACATVIAEMTDILLNTRKNARVSK